MKLTHLQEELWPTGEGPTEWIEVPMIIGCWLCASEQGVDVTTIGADGETEKAFPRNVLRVKVVDRTDPTEAYELTCGHTVI